MNLNSDSYSVQELIDLLGLNSSYSNVDIQNKKRVLEDQLKSRDDLGVEKQSLIPNAYMKSKYKKEQHPRSRIKGVTPRCP